MPWEATRVPDEPPLGPLWHWIPLVPSLLAGTWRCCGAPFLSMQLQNAPRGFGGAETCILRLTMSFDQHQLPSPAVAVGCGPRWACVCPLGSQHPDPMAHFPFLPFLCCRISAQRQRPGDTCHRETTGNSPKIKCKN